VNLADYRSIDHIFAAFKAKGIVFDVVFINAGVTEIWKMPNTKLTSKEIFGKVTPTY
jgi:hypothetical protein